MSDDTSGTIRALSERVREKAAAEREQEPFERRLAQARMGRGALSLARATLAAADLDDGRPAGPFAVELVRRLCFEVHDADPTDGDDREALALLFDAAEEAAVVADDPAGAAEVRGGAALVRHAARTLRETLYPAGHHLFERSGAFRDDPGDGDVPNGSDQVVLLTCHLPYAEALVQKLADEVGTADLGNPGERDAYRVMLDWAEFTAAAGRGLVSEAQALRGLRRKAARVVDDAARGFVRKRPLVSAADRKRLGDLEEDDAVKAAAEALDDPALAVRVGDSAAQVQYMARHLRASLDQAGRRGG
jgi:hypothetical protein